MAKGKKTGGGSRKGIRNKSTLQVKELLDSESDFKAIITKLNELALKGDVSAAKLLMEYRFGKPSQHIELDTNHDISVTIGDNQL